MAEPGVEWEYRSLYAPAGKPTEAEQDLIADGWERISYDVVEWTSTAGATRVLMKFRRRKQATPDS